MEITYNVSKQQGSSRWYLQSPKTPAGEQEGMRLNYTPEEIAEMHDRNENFRGKSANFEKIRLYQAVKHDLVEFKERCGCVQAVDGFDPNIREKHAILWMDFSPTASLDKKQTAALTAIMKKADGAIITTLEGRCTRISFVIKNIWEK